MVYDCFGNWTQVRADTTTNKLSVVSSLLFTVQFSGRIKTYQDKQQNLWCVYAICTRPVVWPHYIGMLLVHWVWENHGQDFSLRPLKLIKRTCFIYLWMWPTEILVKETNLEIQWTFQSTVGTLEVLTVETVFWITGLPGVFKEQRIKKRYIYIYMVKTL